MSAPQVAVLLWMESTGDEPRRGSASPRSIAACVHPDDLKPRGKEKYDSPFDASLTLARKRSQREKLWDMFATYALQISSEEPTRMRVNNVIKLLQDCGVIDTANSDEAKMIEKEVAIVCESYLKTRSSGRDTAKRIDFNAFLGLLMHFAQMSGDQDANRAYDSLVRTCLEKQQKPRSRTRTNVTKDLQECIRVFQAFEDPLTKIFAYFAHISHTKLGKLDPRLAQVAPMHMGYTECIAFARKFGIIAHGVLTTTEFAAIYIDSLSKAPTDECERVLTFDGFCEMLVRISCKACAGEQFTPERKLKGLFQLMWLALSSTSPRGVRITDVLKTDSVDIIKLFLTHFEKFWKKENYDNYVGDRATPGLENEIVGLSLPDAAAVGLPPSPSSRQYMTRRLSLCVQATDSPDGKDGVKTIHRRFSIPAPSPST